MRASLALSLVLLALAGCHPGGDGKPSVKHAWVRLAAVPDRPAAAYFTLEGGHDDDRLVRIDSAVVDKIELHRGTTEGGVMRMRPMKDVALPAGATVEFAPGGDHAMLFGVDPRIVPGTAIPMLFTFGSGASVEVEAKTVPPGDSMAGAHHE
jgi:copper(I)-binding protein